MADMAAKNCPTLFVVPSWNPRMMYRLSSCELGKRHELGCDLRQCFWGQKAVRDRWQICGVDDIG